MAIAFVEDASASADGVTSVTATYATQPVAGYLLVACGFTNHSGGFTAGPTGWTEVATVAGASDETAMWFKIAGAGESSSVTVTAAGTDRHSLVIAQFSGIIGSGPLDVSATQAMTDGVTSTVTGTTATTSDARTVAVAMAGFDGDGQAMTGSAVDSGFTLNQLEENTNLSNYRSGVLMAYEIVTATQTQGCTFSWNETMDAAGIIAVFTGDDQGGAGATNIEIPSVSLEITTAAPTVAFTGGGVTLKGVYSTSISLEGRAS